MRLASGANVAVRTPSVSGMFVQLVRSVVTERIGTRMSVVTSRRVTIAAMREPSGAIWGAATLWKRKTSEGRRARVIGAVYRCATKAEMGHADAALGDQLPFRRAAASSIAAASVPGLADKTASKFGQQDTPRR